MAEGQQLIPVVAPAPGPPPPKTYSAGTLTYTRRGLFLLFFWIIFLSLALTSLGNAAGSFGMPYAIANGTAQMRLYPKDRYVQFVAACGLPSALAMMFGGWAAGKFIDYMDHDYRYMLIWMSLWYSVAYLFTMLLYRHWKKRGGAANYAPATA
jgi:hypothetical protein